MNIAFLDTVGLLALWDERDQWHRDAEIAYKRLLATGAVMLTTEAVLLECGNAAARSRRRRVVALLRRRLMEENRLIFPTPQDMDAGWKE